MISKRLVCGVTRCQNYCLNKDGFPDCRVTELSTIKYGYIKALLEEEINCPYFSKWKIRN